MELKILVCEICNKEARTMEQKRKENWIKIDGGTHQGICVWLESPRKKGQNLMHHVGRQNREYDFCSIDCLIKALNAAELI